MVGSFFVILFILSNWGNVTQFSDVYGLFSPLLGSPLVWLTILLACGGVSLGEILLREKQDTEEQEAIDKYDAETTKQNELIKNRRQSLQKMKT